MNEISNHPWLQGWNAYLSLNNFIGAIFSWQSIKTAKRYWSSLIEEEEGDDSHVEVWCELWMYTYNTFKPSSICPLQGHIIYGSMGNYIPCIAQNQ